MTSANKILEEKILQVLGDLKKYKKPSRNALIDSANEIIKWKQANNIKSLWDKQPLMLTATIDDGWGHGLEVIELYAKAAGLDIKRIGLLQSPENIINSCNKQRPDILGMTVLQFDSEADLMKIRNNIPGKTIIVSGGPLFHADDDFAKRAGIDIVAKNAAEFMNFLLMFKRKSH